MEKWKVTMGYDNIPRIVVDNDISSPVAKLTAYTDWSVNSSVKELVLRNANILAASPTMRDALLKVKAVMDLTASQDDVDNLYYIVENALKEASK